MLAKTLETNDKKEDIEQSTKVQGKKLSTAQRLMKVGAIKVFTPDGFTANENDEELEKLVRRSLGNKIGQRVYRVIAFILHAAITIPLITYSEADFHITKVIAIGLSGMFVAYFLHIYYLIGVSKNAYRIYSLSGTIPNWTTMPITYRQLVYKYSPIQSISEYSAIGGGIANQV